MICATLNSNFNANKIHILVIIKYTIYKSKNNTVFSIKHKLLTQKREGSILEIIFG